jgi:hypothetical protein
MNGWRPLPHPWTHHSGSITVPLASRTFLERISDTSSLPSTFGKSANSTAILKPAAPYALVVVAALLIKLTISPGSTRIQNDRNIGTQPASIASIKMIDAESQAGHQTRERHVRFCAPEAYRAPCARGLLLFSLARIEPRFLPFLAAPVLKYQKHDPPRRCSPVGLPRNLRIARPLGREH